MRIRLNPGLTRVRHRSGWLSDFLWFLLRHMPIRIRSLSHKLGASDKSFWRFSVCPYFGSLANAHKYLKIIILWFIIINGSRTAMVLTSHKRNDSTLCCPLDDRSLVGQDGR